MAPWWKQEPFANSFVYRVTKNNKNPKLVGEWMPSSESHCISQATWEVTAIWQTMSRKQEAGCAMNPSDYKGLRTKQKWQPKTRLRIP